MADARNLWVGLFVTSAIALFVALTVWITGKRGDEPTHHYSILFEDNVKIRVDIEILATVPVDSGTWATLSAQGITGISVVNLSSDPGEHPPLALTPGYEYPLIAQRDTGLSALMSTAPSILDKTSLLLDRTGALFNEENRTLVSDALRNIESITGSLAAQESAYRDVPMELTRTLEDVRALVGELRDLVASAKPEVQATVQNINDATRQLSDASKRLENWLVRHEHSLDAFTGEGLGEVPELVDAARASSRACARTRRN